MESGGASIIEAQTPSIELIRRSLERAQNTVLRNLDAINRVTTEKGSNMYSSFTAITASDSSFSDDPEMVKLFSNFRHAVVAHVRLMTSRVNENRTTRLRKTHDLLYNLAENGIQGKIQVYKYPLDKQYILSDRQLKTILGSPEEVVKFRHSQAMLYSDLSRKEGKVVLGKKP